MDAHNLEHCMDNSNCNTKIKIETNDAENKNCVWVIEETDVDSNSLLFKNEIVIDKDKNETFPRIKTESNYDSILIDSESFNQSSNDLNPDSAKHFDVCRNPLAEATVNHSEKLKSEFAIKEIVPLVKTESNHDFNFIDSESSNQSSNDLNQDSSKDFDACRNTLPEVSVSHSDKLKSEFAVKDIVPIVKTESTYDSILIDSESFNQSSNDLNSDSSKHFDACRNTLAEATLNHSDKLKSTFASDITIQSYLKQEQLSNSYGSAEYAGNDDDDDILIIGEYDPSPKKNPSRTDEHLSGLKENLNCANCEQPFKDEKLLEKHLSEKFSGELFICNYCDKKFTRKSCADYHISNTHKAAIPGAGRKITSEKTLEDQNDPAESEEFMEIIECDQDSGPKISLIECKLCPFKFLKQQDFNAHMKNQHSPSRQFAPVVPKNTSLKSDLNNLKNMRFKTRNDSTEQGKNCLFQCKHCSASFFKPSIFNAHMLRQHSVPLQSVSEGLKITEVRKCTHYERKDYLYECNICPAKCQTKELVDLHMKSHEEERKHECHICNVKFKRECDLTRHTFYFHLPKHVVCKPDRKKEEQYMCNICSVMYNSKELLRVHLKSHDSKRNFKCNFCKVNFKRKIDLNRHLFQQHRREVTPSDFATSQYLQVPPYPHQCPFCPIKFPDKNELKLHLDEYLHKCPLCPFLFKNETDIKNHNSTCHDNIQPYECTTCGRVITKLSDLNSHVCDENDIKLKNRLYKCPHCPFSCKNETDLQNHNSLFHDNIQPYECPTCGRLITKLNDLNSHLCDENDIKLKNRLYRCPICPFSCKNETDFQIHDSLFHDKVQRYKCPSCSCFVTSSNDLLNTHKCNEEIIINKNVDDEVMIVG